MRVLNLPLAFLLLISSCTSTKSSVKPSAAQTFAIADSTREKVRGTGNVTLLDHQLLPIDYLHKHDDVKGLLINHYMGTGKTFLGIGFAQSYPDRPVIILAPKFLESHWMNELEAYGVTNPKRFMFVSYDDAPAKLSTLDVSKHILLADEVHNLIKHMRSIDSESNTGYTQVYTNLRNAHKILALTGTPIYGDESDLAFMMNFVSNQNLMPFNQEAFRLEYTEILKSRQFFRGYFTESNLMVAVLPPALTLFSLGFLGALAPAIAFPVGIFVPVVVNLWLDPNVYRLRQLNVEKMKPMMSKYVSYFRFNEAHFKDFPAQDLQIVEVPYSHQQYSFFLKLIEGDLPVTQLQRLLKNEPVQRSDQFVEINSTNIHEQIYSVVGAGRDIGNFEFIDSKDTTVESPKFLRIYDELKKGNEQSVVYSNYFNTGILAFRDFLVRQNYKENFAIIEPNLSVSEVTRIVKEYNSGVIKLLLLHPDVTEGISLKGTQHLHILEPMLNSTVLEQVIGRTRRFQSHSHLPKEKQKVNVRIWLSTSSTWNPTLSDINRANWYKRYRELAYFSRWGIGISQVDKKIDRKVLNPEELALLKLKTIEKNLSSMQTVLTQESIENQYVTSTDR